MHRPLIAKFVAISGALVATAALQPAHAAAGVSDSEIVLGQTAVFEGPASVITNTRTLFNDDIGLLIGGVGTKALVGGSSSTPRTVRAQSVEHPAPPPAGHSVQGRPPAGVGARTVPRPSTHSRTGSSQAIPLPADLKDF